MSKNYRARPNFEKKCTFRYRDNLRKLMDDMLDTMYAAPGIGLVAVQVGILKRLVVIDISKENEKKNQYS